MLIYTVDDASHGENTHSQMPLHSGERECWKSVLVFQLAPEHS
jgi:hypothetical protein